MEISGWMIRNELQLQYVFKLIKKTNAVIFQLASAKSSSLIKYSPGKKPFAIIRHVIWAASHVFVIESRDAKKELYWKCPKLDLLMNFIICWGYFRHQIIAFETLIILIRHESW